jgi:Tfp pilus assembly ATPase PilU
MRLAVVGALVGATCQRLVPTVNGHGRLPAVEVLVSTPATRLALVTADDDKLSQEMAAGAAHGMQTLDQSLVALLSSGAIDLRGAMAATADWHALRALLAEADVAEPDDGDEVDDADDEVDDADDSPAPAARAAAPLPDWVRGRLLSRAD